MGDTDLAEELFKDWPGWENLRPCKVHPGAKHVVDFVCDCLRLPVTPELLELEHDPRALAAQRFIEQRIELAACQREDDIARGARW